MKGRLATLLLILLTGIVSNAQNRYKEARLPAVMKALDQNQDIVILDVRTKGEYHDTLSVNKHLNIGRIKGAINIPIQELQSDSNAVKKLDDVRDKEIFVICSHSYRSRAVSNLLMQKGFRNVTNIRGGMSEWFRDYEGLREFRDEYWERGTAYQNISPSELYQRTSSGEKFLVIGFWNKPVNFFDSAYHTLFKFFPDFRQVNYFQPADSLKLLNLVNKERGKNIVLFNTNGRGAAEAADWLTQKGITGVHYLYGNLLWYYEYLVNNHTAMETETNLKNKSGIRFFTPQSLCKEKLWRMQIIDLRHDTLFSKKTNGTKLSYYKLKNAENFPYYLSVAEFEKRFPDKGINYVLSPHSSFVGIELANALAKKGYSIGWIIGGTERWEWYQNNVEGFLCEWLE